MKLQNHPEHGRYQADKALLADIAPAVADWLAAGQPLATETAVFTPTMLRQLFAQLVDLFRAYNRVLWQEFDYCRQCRGGCCVVGASQVTAVDAVALTVLAEKLPDLPDQTKHDDRACIYLGVAGCTWPSGWRPLKCQIFYCLGSGDWQLDAADVRYGRLTHRLQQTVSAHWPPLLPGHEALADLLADPLHFAEALTAVLQDQVISPLSHGLDLPDQPPDSHSSTGYADPLAGVPTFVAAMLERLDALPEAGATDVLDLYADLETLQWLAAGRPGNGRVLLQEVYGRYAQSRPADSPELADLRREMAAQVSLLCENLAP